MNRTETLEEFSPCNDPTIVKRKRSKRLRPSSSSASSKSGGGGGELNCNASPSSSSGISTSTSEDEDMANCLILLARGGFRTTSSDEEAIEKSSSRKLTEMSAAGAYDYECKTCSRTFSSFQALGGHRASHKKPKQGIDSIADDRKKLPPPRVPAQLMLPSKTSVLKVDNKSSKIHECSVCGSEFGSGQALGGHMRRHRSATTVRPSASRDDEKAKNTLALNLDLNLPAPREDDFRGHFTSDQQPRIVFSAAALVHCHY